MPNRMSYWLLPTAEQTTAPFPDLEGRESRYEIAPDSKITKGDTVYLWWVIDGFMYGWGVVSETPRIEVVAPDARKRLIVTVIKKVLFEPLARSEIEADEKLAGLIPSSWNDLQAVLLDTVTAYRLNDVIRARGLRSPEGSAPVGWLVEQVHVMKTLRLTGWKSIRETEPPLEFGPLNVLIGANGSGKSNLISFFKLL